MGPYDISEVFGMYECESCGSNWNEVEWMIDDESWSLEYRFGCYGGQVAFSWEEDAEKSLDKVFHALHEDHPEWVEKNASTIREYVHDWVADPKKYATPDGWGFEDKNVSPENSPSRTLLTVSPDERNALAGALYGDGWSLASDEMRDYWLEKADVVVSHGWVPAPF